jgi:Photosynthesis affected mutant 68
MSSESNEQKSTPLPFEPASKKKAEKPIQPNRSARRNAEPGIPEEVTQRMMRRMMVFSGFPSFLGMATFVVSYFVVTKLNYDLPNSAVLLVSLGFFGLGVVGLSYGILSASWEPEQSGSLLGTQEFSTNFSRMKDAWKEARRQAIANQPKK